MNIVALHFLEYNLRWDVEKNTKALFATRIVLFIIVFLFVRLKCPHFRRDFCSFVGQKKKSAPVDNFYNKVLYSGLKCNIM